MVCFRADATSTGMLVLSLPPAVIAPAVIAPDIIAVYMYMVA